jgi:hypothetical protein
VRRLALAVLALAAPAVGAGAQTNDHLFRSWRWTGDAAAPRAAGLAGTMTAVDADLAAAVHNPAGLAALTKSEAAVALLSRRPGDAPPGDALSARTGIGFAGVAARIGPRLVLAATLAETHARRTRLDDTLALPDGVPERGTLESVASELALSAGWRLTPRVHVGGRVARSRLTLDGQFTREPVDGPVEVRVATSGEPARVATAFGLTVEPVRRLRLGAMARSEVRWRLTRTAVSPLLGTVIDPGSGYDVRQPRVLSLGASLEPSLKLRLVAQLDRVGYGDIAAGLVIGQGAHRRDEYALGDAWEPRAAVELSLPRRASSLQLRAGVHWQAAGALRYTGSDPGERAAFVGGDRQAVLAAGVSLVTPRWVRLDVAAQFGGERNVITAGLAGRF